MKPTLGFCGFLGFLKNLKKPRFLKTHFYSPGFFSGEKTPRDICASGGRLLVASLNEPHSLDNKKSS